MADEILNLDDACTLLGIKHRTMYKLLKENAIPAIKIGGQWRFSRENLMGLFNGSVKSGQDSKNE